MRIAVFLERLNDGTGGFQQALSTIESLTCNNATKHEFLIFTQFDETRRQLSEHGIEALLFKHRGYRLIDRWSATVLGGAVLRRLQRLGLRRLGRHLDALLDDHAIDLVLLTECGEIAQRIGDHPFIVTVWDLWHREHPYFPEIYRSRQFEQCERVARAALPRALAVIADSRAGARLIASLYQVDPGRIIELPFLPSLAVRRHAMGNGLKTVDEVRSKYALPDTYAFYPSFPANDKNHFYLLEGLADLERRHGIALHAVLCGGGEPQHWAMVERQVRALGLTSRVHFLGLVPGQDIPALYQGALALVMPTYTGATNLPPLEAVTLGCPVIYSDLPEFREQMGDAALYCDLADPASLADHLAALIQDSAIRDRLRAAGRRRAAEIEKINYSERLAPVFDHYAYISRRWTWPERLE